MKALKSPLAKQVLADPAAKAQLRAFLAAKSTPPAEGPRRVPPAIEVHSANGTLRVRPVVVPKAA